MRIPPSIIPSKEPSRKDDRWQYMRDNNWNFTRDKDAVKTHKSYVDRMKRGMGKNSGMTVNVDRFVDGYVPPKATPQIKPISKKKKKKRIKDISLLSVVILFKRLLVYKQQNKKENADNAIFHLMKKLREVNINLDDISGRSDEWYFMDLDELQCIYKYGNDTIKNRVYMIIYARLYLMEGDNVKTI
jgi:hypothetical protein